MTGERVKAVLVDYVVQLTRDHRTVPVRNADAPGLRDRLNHLHWMCDEAYAFVSEGRLEKAFRWLGFIQGAFWSLGIRTVEEAKRDNMPPGEPFDRQHK